VFLNHLPVRKVGLYALVALFNDSVNFEIFSCFICRTIT
jgi:hypothetical protein